MSLPNISTPVQIQGRYFWQGEDRFLIRGVVYQIPWTTPVVDPISDDRLSQLEQDVELFKDLGLNALFVYFIDPTKEHARAMKLLENAGIYVLTTITARPRYINRMSPRKSYAPEYASAVFKIVDVMAQYSNTLGVLVANRLVNKDAHLTTVPIMKAIVRDLKKYMKLKSEITKQRILPIGYGANSYTSRDLAILKILRTADVAGSIDFWACTRYISPTVGVNAVASVYDDLVHLACSFDLPIFLSEYGGIVQDPRSFQETKILYSPQIATVLSGGMVYEFWQSTNGYGLVELLDTKSEPESSAHQRALSRAGNPNKVTKKYQTDRGLLLILHDYANLKKNLAASFEWESRGLSRTGKIVPLKREVQDAVQKYGLEDEEFREPDSCVDWDEMETVLQSMG